MDNKEKLQSGNTLSITLAPIKDSYRLFQAVVLEFKKNGIDLKLDRDTDLNFLKIFENNVSACLEGLANIITSDSVLEIIMEMGQRCVYTANGVSNKVSMDIFEEEANRRDFFEVIMKIALRNLKPFFQSPLSK